MRGGHDRRARASVAGEDHRSPRTGRTDQAFWSDRPTVRQSDRFTLRELAPKGALRDPRRLGFLGVEPPAPLVLLQRVPDGPAPVLRGKNENGVLFPLPPSPAFYRVSSLYFADLDLKRDSLDPELDRLAEQLLCATRTVQRDRLGSGLQPERADQPDHAEEVVGVEMGEEDLREREAHPVAQQLALGAFPALAQQRLTLAHESQGRDVALYRRPSGCRAKESDGKHGGEYRAAWGGNGRQQAARCLMPPHAAPCRPLPPSAALEHFDVYVPPGPFPEVREEGRQGRESGIQVLIQHRIARHLAERPLALVHLVEHAFERPGRVGEAAGELGEIGAQRVEPRARLLDLGRA